MVEAPTTQTQQTLTPVPSDSGATQAETTVIDLFNAATTAAENLIIAAVPALGIPVLKQIWELIFSWITGYIGKAFGEGAAFIVIDIQVWAQVQKVLASSTALAQAQATGDPNAIATARAASDAAAQALFTFNGSGQS